MSRKERQAITCKGSDLNYLVWIRCLQTSCHAELFSRYTMMSPCIYNVFSVECACLPMHVWVFSECLGFLPKAKTILIRKTGHSQARLCPNPLPMGPAPCDPPHQWGPHLNPEHHTWLRSCTFWGGWGSLPAYYKTNIADFTYS